MHLQVERIGEYGNHPLCSPSFAVCIFKDALWPASCHRVYKEEHDDGKLEPQPDLECQQGEPAPLRSHLHAGRRHDRCGACALRKRGLCGSHGVRDAHDGRVDSTEHTFDRVVAREHRRVHAGGHAHIFLVHGCMCLVHVWRQAERLERIIHAAVDPVVRSGTQSLRKPTNARVTRRRRRGM